MKPPSRRTRRRIAAPRTARGAAVLAVCLGVLLLAAGRPAPATAWTWPVQGRVVTQYLNDNSRPYAGGMHRGIDIAAPVGTAVVAAMGGRVTYAAPLGSSGLTVAIATTDGRYETSYLHLSEIAVERGTSLETGETIGAVGTSGERSASEPHLHFGVRQAGSDHLYVDPLTLLPPLPAAGPEPAPGPVAAAEPVRAAPAPVPAARPLGTPVPRPRPAGAIRPLPRAAPAPAGRSLRPVPVTASPVAVPRPSRLSETRSAPAALPVPSARPARVAARPMVRVVASPRALPASAPGPGRAKRLGPVGEERARPAYVEKGSRAREQPGRDWGRAVTLLGLLLVAVAGRRTLSTVAIALARGLIGDRRPALATLLRARVRRQGAKQRTAPRHADAPAVGALSQMS